jgi:hypothetical protein
LKTKKSKDNPLNMEDIGQCFHHIEWASAQADRKILGLIAVSPCTKRSPESKPSSEMWASDLGRFRALFEEFNQTLLATQRIPPNLRYAGVEALAQRAEWQPQALFARIRGVPLEKLKT